MSEQPSCIECTEILPFSFSEKMGATKVDDCACEKGYFRSTGEFGETKCKLCADVIPNSFTTKMGATSNADCICKVGFYDSRLNTSNDNDDKSQRCLPCPEGANCTMNNVTLNSMLSLRGYWRARWIDTEFYKCSDVASPGSEPSNSEICSGGDIDSQCAKGRDKNVPLCDECLSGWIAPAGTVICSPCEAQEGPDMGLVMIAMSASFLLLFFTGSFFYMRSSAMIFSMMDENNNGFITEKEFMHACRHYQSIKESRMSDKRLKYLYLVFHDGNPKGIRRFVFKSLWMHTLAESHHKSQKNISKGGSYGRLCLQIKRIKTKQSNDDVTLTYGP